VRQVDEAHPIPASPKSQERGFGGGASAAYGWAEGLFDEEVLEKLLALNLERAQA